MFLDLLKMNIVSPKTSITTIKKPSFKLRLLQRLITIRKAGTKTLMETMQEKGEREGNVLMV